MSFGCFPQSNGGRPTVDNIIRLPPISTHMEAARPRDNSQLAYDRLEGLLRLQTSSSLAGDGPGSNIPSLDHVVRQSGCRQTSEPSEGARTRLASSSPETWFVPRPESRSASSVPPSKHDYDSSGAIPARRGSALAKHKHTRQQQRQRRELTLKIKMLEMMLEKRVLWRGDRRQTGQKRAQRAHQAGLPRPANNASKSGLTYEKGVIIDGGIGATAALATVLDVLGIDPTTVGNLLPQIAFRQMSATTAAECDGGHGPEMVDSSATREFEGIIEAAKVRMVEEAFRELRRRGNMP